MDTSASGQHQQGCRSLISYTLAQLAEVVGGVVRGDPQRRIQGVNGLAEAVDGEIAFYNNTRYRDDLKRTRACAVLIDEATVDQVQGPDALVVKDPYLSFAKISAIFHPRPKFAPGIDPRAVVEPGAQIDPTATIMAFCYVGHSARVGAGSVLFPGVFLGAQSVVGVDAIIYPHVVVREQCTVGDRVILQPGVMLGGDGFGFAFDAATMQHFKIPQTGMVEVQNDVEIGSNSAVDRATMGRTVIGQGSKLDNLVQVGHNVQVGALSVLCGHVGIAGSSELGQAVICGGQVGIGNHVKIASGVRIGAQSGVKDNLDEPGDYLGTPAMPLNEFVRANYAFKQGQDTRRTMLRLEKRVAQLEAQLAALATSAKT